MTYTGHTTRRYRVEGMDLFLGVVLNGAANLGAFAAHAFHRWNWELPRHHERAAEDPCFPAAVAMSYAGLSLWMIAKRRRMVASGKLEEQSESDLAFLRARTRWDWLNSYGVLYNGLMILEGAVIACWLSSLFGAPVTAMGQAALVVAFWTTAFTYLPVLGAVRVLGRRNDRKGGFFRVYWRTHGMLLVFPAAAALHGLVLTVVLTLGFDALLPGDLPFWERVRPALPGIGGFSLILGFFSALPLHRRYERWIFGRNVLPDPEKLRAREIRKTIEAIEKDQSGADRS